MRFTKGLVIKCQLYFQSRRSRTVITSSLTYKRMLIYIFKNICRKSNRKMGSFYKNTFGLSAIRNFATVWEQRVNYSAKGLASVRSKVRDQRVASE